MNIRSIYFYHYQPKSTKLTGDDRFQCWECFDEFENDRLQDSKYQTDSETNCQTTSDENTSSEKESTIIKQKYNLKKKKVLSDITNDCLESPSLPNLNDVSDVRY